MNARNMFISFLNFAINMLGLTTGLLLCVGLSTDLTRITYKA